MEQKQPLRFVILCDSTAFPKWQADCIREVIASGLAVPVGLVIHAIKEAPGNKWSKRWRNRQYVLWRLYNKFYVDVFSKATIMEDMDFYLSKVPRLSDCPLKVGKFGQRLTEGAINFVRQCQPHFVLRFGFGILKGEILKTAPFGVWSYHHGDPSKFRGQPPGFWEIYTGSPVTGSILQLLSDDLDAGTVLHSGAFQTAHHSYVKERDTIYFGSSSWIRRTCSQIQENGWPLRACLNSVGPIWKQPNNLQMIKFLLITARNFIRVHLTYRLFTQDWTCGVVPAPIHTVAGLDGPDKQRQALEKTVWMKRPLHCFVADPFGYDTDKSSHIRILFELFDKRNRRGVIAAASYFQGKFSDVQMVMNSAFHLSYPYIFHDGGDIYFIPEHSAGRDISAFHLNEAGKIDKKVTIMPHSELLDSTIFRWNGKFWLFAADDSKSKNTDLVIYFAENWRGPWFSHPLNPVKTDVRNSRPAGTPFIHEGKLYRPSQDCSTHYGGATVVSEVIQLTESDFDEEVVARVQPWPSSIYTYGLHTISQAGSQFTVIDGAQKKIRFSS